MHIFLFSDNRSQIYTNPTPKMHCLLSLLISGNIELNPGPQSSLHRKLIPKSAVDCLVLNAWSLTSRHKTNDSNKEIWNLHRFQDLVYAGSYDVVFVNETWLTSDIYDAELLDQDYVIFRKDRTTRRGGGVLIGVKLSLFRSVKEYSSPTTTDLPGKNFSFGRN